MKTPDTSLPRPAISVVVPVYRVPEAYLVPSAESLRAQTFGNAEFLYVLDGPDPAAEGLLRGVFAGDARFSLTVLPENGGVSKARNAAIAKARGTYCCFVDADDRLPDGILGKVAAEMERHPGTDLYVGLSRGLRADPFAARRCFFAPPDVGPVALGDGELARFTVWSEAAAWGKFYRTALLSGGFPEDLRYYEDTCFVWRLLGKAETAAFLPYSVYTVVPRPGSAYRAGLSDDSRRNSVRGLLELARMPLPPHGGEALLRVRQSRLLIELFVSVLLLGLSPETASALLPGVREVASVLASPPYPRLSLPLRALLRRRLSSPEALARPERFQQLLLWDAYRMVTAPWRCEPRFLTALAVAAPPLYRRFAPRFWPLS